MASVSSHPPCQELCRQIGARVPTDQGEFQLLLYRDGAGLEHLAFVLGEVRDQSEVLVRLHSECFTGDVLGSLRCDCGPQLRKALDLLSAAGRGVLLYLRQEGRGIGLADKLRAYNLQDLGFDTVDANLQLGHPSDARDYNVAALILRDLGVASVRLITNNPGKLQGLAAGGIQVAARVPLQVPASSESAAYLRTKELRMNHQLTSPWPPGWEPGEGNLVTLAFHGDGLEAVGPARPGPLTQPLAAWHDGVLVGIGTVLASDCDWRVLTGPGRTVVLDPRWCFPASLAAPGLLIAGRGEAPASLRQSEAALMQLPELSELSGRLAEHGMRRLLVAGGNRLLNAFLKSNLAQRVVVAGLRHMPLGRLRRAVWEEDVLWAELT